MQSARAGKEAICIVTSVPISYNPRVVKEADALSEAGYRVRVVSPLTDDYFASLDEGIAAARSWQWNPIDVRRILVAPLMRWLSSGIVSSALKAVPGIEKRDTVLDHAYSRYAPSLAAEAAGIRADMYIAHNLPALPAAAKAARQTGAALGFDAEDFHRGQFSAGEKVAGRQAFELTMAVERRHIPRAVHVTAASDGIGRAYAQELGIALPTTVLNAFPLGDREARVSAAELARERRGPGLSLYWYSQVIGPDRGLADAIHALARLEGLHLHVRGAVSDYVGAMLKQAEGLGVRGRVHVLDPVAPVELVVRAGQHDIGLALEEPLSPNRDLCVTNKMLAFLLAGLAVAATDTSGQRGIMSAAEGAGFLYAPGDVEALASRLRELRDSPAALAAAKARAGSVAEQRFCWDVEKPKLLGAVERAMAPGNSPGSK